MDWDRALGPVAAGRIMGMADGEVGFRGLLLVILLIGFGMSGAFRRRARQASGTIERGSESPGLIAMRLVVGLPYFLGLVVWLVRPQWLDFAALPLPAWLRWAGVALAVACLPLMAWVLRSIGSNISETVLVKAQHELVTSGPYRWVRHPLYSVGSLLFLSTGLISANAWLLGFALAIAIGIRWQVVPREEAALIERFGDRYRAYRERTGALIPRP